MRGGNAVIDFSSPDLRRNPFPFYAQVRGGNPVLHDPAIDAWLIFDYASVKQALTDPDLFSSSMSYASRGNPDWIIFMDPPRHAKLRSLISQAFTLRAISNLEQRVRTLSCDLLDEVIDRGEMDLVADYATPLPMMVIAEMIGIPSTEWARFRAWSDVILRLSHTLGAGPAASAAVMEYAVVKAEMTLYLQNVIDQRRAKPRNDLLSRLVHAEVDGERLGDDEIEGFLELLIVAGQETTSNLISNAVLSFSQFPAELRRLTRSWDLLPGAIEEILRYRSPVQWVFRSTLASVTMHGQVIPAGKLVLPLIGSANRDPQHFPEPDRFDITRNPNAHLAFGHGIHFCIGAALARLEARVALPDLYRRLIGLEVVDTEPWNPRDAFHVLGPSRLLVRFEPGTPFATTEAAS